MLIDARNLGPDELVRADVCIVGSGPAGVTLARELADRDVRVVVLESGGLELDPAAQELNDVHTVGDPFLSPRLTRHRQFGGNSNAWAIKIGDGELGVRYAPLDAIDLEQRDAVPHSGWPVTLSELQPFYARAQKVCQIGPNDYSARGWQRAGSEPLPLDPARVLTGMFQFGPRAAFFAQYKEELDRSRNVHVYVHATALELEADDSLTRVARLKVGSAPGRTFRVEAKQFVMAMGGIENARLLLQSNRQQAAGLGNAHDLVGRYFMDHPLVDGGLFVPSTRARIDDMSLYDLRRVDGTAVLGRLGLAPQLLRSEGLLNCALLLFPRPSVRQTDAIVAFKAIAESAAQRAVPPDLVRKLGQTALGLDYVLRASYLAARHKQSLYHGFGRGGWSELRGNEKRFQSFQVFMQTEQAPDADNRLVLADDRDAFGSRKLELRWRWGKQNRDSVVRTQALLAQELARAGVGRFEIKRVDGEPDLCTPSGVAHHMGTTRMHVDPRQGVVDATGRVHQLSNLYMAGSSVFPTGGYANPTLTIVALAARMADHLKAVLPSARGLDAHKVA
ncbi:MAG TPA: GMC family oxidoreductase [Polyangiales bacterium]|nr:GMC family oxidoreductase [Polyangiales bacterium]